jgi:hypothetical protein
MNATDKVRALLMIALLVGGGVEIGEWLAIPGVRSAVATVQAVVGRPLTPVSVSGVARRTSRRND